MKKIIIDTVFAILIVSDTTKDNALLISGKGFIIEARCSQPHGITFNGLSGSVETSTTEILGYLDKTKKPLAKKFRVWFSYSK